MGLRNEGMKLSIITINYNNAAGLKATLDSVVVQTFREFEHIIVDGGSTDGSIEVIEEYVRKVEGVNESRNEGIHVVWLSEPDKGIYNAMNKGIEIALGKRVVDTFNRSTLCGDKNKGDNRSELVEDKDNGIKKTSGDYLYFLNSGDTLVDNDVLHEMMCVLDGSDFVIGRVNKVSQGCICGQSELLSEADMSMYQMYLHGINHQSALIRQSLRLEHLYDATLKIGADWKFFVEAIVLNGAKVKFVDTIFANYDVSGVSSNTPQLRNEREKILVDILPERIARDYLAIAPHYYEVTRIDWLLRHPIWYKLYRCFVTIGRKIMKN